MEADLGITAEAVGRHFLRPYWQDIVNGRAALVECLNRALSAFAPPDLTVDALIAYWFEQDSRLVQGREHRFVQQLVPEPGVEALGRLKSCFLG